MIPIFYLSMFLLFYVYLGYPACAFILSVIRNKKIQKEAIEPTITLLIAAYNEESCIEQTLQNKLGLDYPKSKLEIIVISDGSTDRTDKITKQYESENVKLLRQEPRSGKTAAFNKAVPVAKGDILVFSDANSLYADDVLKKLVRNFSDSSVGYVTGKMMYTNPDGSTIGDGCSAYMKYENQLRQYETRMGSIVGVDGGVDAVRKALYKQMNPDQLPDFVLPLKVVEQGYRVVYEPEAVLKECSLKDPKDEYKMRVRVSLRALWAIKDMRKLLSLKKFPLFAWQLWSHKVLRYLCFIFMLTAYLSNLALLNEHMLYKTVFLLQSMVYLFAVLSPVIKKKSSILKVPYFCYYYVLINIACAHAFAKFLLRKKLVVWTPRKG